MKKDFHKNLFVLLVVTALLLSACAPSLSGGAGDNNGGSQATPAANPQINSTQENNQNSGQSTTPDMSIARDILLDPANATDADSLFVLGYLYEGLVKLQADGLAPALAESWSASDDGLDYIFTLRQNVTFHDGTPFNSDAVIANFNRWFDPEDPAHGAGEYAAWAAIFGGFKGETDESGAPKSYFDGAEKVDDYTVIIHLTRPDENFLAKLVNPAFDMVSPTAFGADYFGTSLGKEGGTGPYQLTNWGDSSLTLEPFTAYWNGAPAEAVELPFK